ncbi:MAG TPA: ATP-binding protein [Verrucomicrobiae bacterium]
MVNPIVAVDFAAAEETLENERSLDRPPGPGEGEREDRRVNILLVDDTPENLIALEAVLSELGQNLVKAKSGEEALRLLLKQEFAVILLDVNMPGLNGFETAEMIRQRKSTEHIPIIFVSAISTSDTHLFKGYSLGAVDYIFTPVIPEVLRSKVTVFVELLKKTEETKRQAEQLRELEEKEHREKMNEAARRIELQTKHNRFFTLAVDLLAITSFDGQISELNPAWEALLGYSEKELKSRPFWDRMDQEDRTTTKRGVEAAVKLQKPISFESQYPCADGTSRCFSWTVAPYQAEQLLYLFGRDVTDARRAEGEIKKLNRDLEQRARELGATNTELQAEIATRQRAEVALQESNAALEAFSYSVSHDLRAPIRAMQGFARVLLEDYGSVLDQTGKDCALRIVTAAERMDNLVHDLLIFSRLGHTKLDLHSISVHEVVLECVVTLEQELKAKEAVVEIVEPLPRVVAHGTTLTQVLTNLIANGTKFVGSGVKPRVKVWAEQKDGFATICVKDNGIGISAENQARIFRVFERLHGADDYPGTGLGLAIVKKGVERMNGEVGVDSTLGGGARFWVKLPVASGK